MTPLNPRDYLEPAALRDGGSVLIRAIRPTDKPQIEKLFGHLGPQSRWFRFFQAKRSLTSQELSELTDLDFGARLGLAAIHREDGEDKIIGVAHLFRTSRPDEAPRFPIQETEGFLQVSIASLGPILVAGLGGVQVELLRDVAFRLTPVSDLDAREMLAGLRTAKLLDGFRGSPPADRQALVDAILRISALVESVPELLELELNPLKVLLPGHGAIIVDARVRIAGRVV
ncbi:MAG TPA: acetate--CoA ligase family protein [Gemmatimonadales bacterium]|nr:acetate--CoA ligase family protein [Gemmatimonadales bacterium]